jgi:thioredoxin reductase/Pyruvate/2-oxoacid:ferredoxin oxidoreductase delta subunit
MLLRALDIIFQWMTDNLALSFFAIVGGLVVLSRSGQRKKHHKKAQAKLKKAIDSQMNEPMTLHPDIDTSLCIGCGACTLACPEGEILQLINHKAVLVTPTKCVGHGECEVVCPMGAIDLVFGTKTRGMDIPRVSTNYETNVPGLYIAGELGGMGLIRNAAKQGVLSSDHALANLPSAAADYDLIIVGAGPAGIAAGMNAIAKKKKYLLLEQNAFGGTVYSFPRQKLVMSHPFNLPLTGVAKFPKHEVSKEDLLAYFEKVKGEVGLKVKEKTRFENIEKVGDIFKVKTSQGEFTARKVILAMGVRGSPRKLGVPGEEKSKVTYNLIDPEQYQNKKVVVVGGGNAGAEVAQMLADKKWNNTVYQLVRSATFDRCNEDNQNRVRALEKEGRLNLWFNSGIVAIHDDHVEIKKENEVVKVPNDFVFVMAGAELPHKFLSSVGIKIEKKFGEGLAKAQ